MNYPRNKGYWVRITYQGAILIQKLFSDGIYGSAEKALTTALAWRNKQYKKYPQVKQREDVPYEVVYRKNNKSGIIGVFYSHTTARCGITYYYWAAAWCPEPNILKVKRFYVHVYGDDIAKQLAIEFRKEKELEMKEEAAIKKEKFKSTVNLMYITEMNYARNKGYWVRFYRQRQLIRQRSFALELYGSWGDALLTAIDWRDEQLQDPSMEYFKKKMAGDKVPFYSVITPSNNTSGVVGVHLATDVIHGKKVKTWVATCSVNNKPFTKKFYIHTTGFEKAQRFATLCRKSMEHSIDLANDPHKFPNCHMIGSACNVCTTIVRLIRSKTRSCDKEL